MPQDDPPTGRRTVTVAADGPWLTTRDVATHYSKPESTIRYWRLRGYGPKGVKVGRDTLYSPASILAFDAELQALAEGQAPAQSA